MIMFDSGPSTNGTSLALNGAAVTGAQINLTSTAQPPRNVGLVLVVRNYAAGGSVNGFNALVQSASSSTGTFVTGTSRVNQITANGTYTLTLASSDFRHIRLALQRNDGAATADVDVYWMYDTRVGAADVENASVLGWTRALRAAAAVSAATNVDFDVAKYSAGAAEAVRIVFTTTVSAGNVSVQLKGSMDGTTYWDMPQGTAGGPQSTNGEAQVVLSSAGVASLALGGAIPPYLRAVLTPAGFTGTVAVDAASTSFLIP